MLITVKIDNSVDIKNCANFAYNKRIKTGFTV